MLYSESDVIEASGLSVGGSSLAVSDWMVEQRIHEALPGISTAEVSLAIPDTLRIRISETPALAVLDTENGSVLLSRSCQVVRGYAGDEAELIHIRGISPTGTDVGQTLGVDAGESTKISYLQELLDELERADMLESVEDIDISNVTDLHFRYQERFTVRLGKQEKLAKKLTFLRNLTQELNIGDKGILDLSKEYEGHYIPG